MSSMRALNGSSAVALAVKQAVPDVVAVHPILPTTLIAKDIAALIADAELDTEFLNMESEHSAMSSCIGASASGGRVFTTAAAQGLAAMHDLLYIASSYRLPIVTAIANSALSAPLAIGPDHSDMMGQSNCGWIQLMSENSQEAYDNIIQAYKIAEENGVRTPVMVGMDSLCTSHTIENVIVENEEAVTDFLGKYDAQNSLLDSDNPKTIGSYCGNDYYFQHKLEQSKGIESSRKAIKEVGKEFGDRFGRYYGYFESYKLDDALTAVVVMGSAAGTVKEWIDKLRSKGEKTGVLKLRILRPFPHQELGETLTQFDRVLVLDRSLVPGTDGGPLFNELKAALYEFENHPQVLSYIYGLGGRDLGLKHLEELEALLGETEDIETAGLKHRQVGYINPGI